MQKSTKDDEAEEGSLKQKSLASDSDSPSICLETNNEKGSPVRELGDEPPPGAVDHQAANSGKSGLSVKSTVFPDDFASSDETTAKAEHQRRSVLLRDGRATGPSRRTTWMSTYVGNRRRATTDNEVRRRSASYQDFISGKTKSFCKYKSTVDHASFEVSVDRELSKSWQRTNSRLETLDDSNDSDFFETAEVNDQIANELQIRALIASQLRSNFLFLSFNDTQIIEIAQEFEAVEYEPGTAIITQGYIEENMIHMYILVKGECVVVIDGKEVHGRYGKIEESTLFGELAMLSNAKSRAATIVAVGSDKVVVYRLNSNVYRRMIGDEEISWLCRRMQGIQGVVDTLSGVDTTFGKGTVIRPYKPSSYWLLKQWKGTILQYVWPRVTAMMVMTALLGLLAGFIVKKTSLEVDWPNSKLDTIDTMWSRYISFVAFIEILIPLVCKHRYPFPFALRGTTFTTFVTTFFLTEAFRFWKEFYWTIRRIQGRFNDISLLLASTVTRNHNDGKLTEGAIAALDDVARIQTLTHQLFWCKAVNKFRCLLSPEGFSYLLSKKLITKSEYASLIQVGENGLAPHKATITWLTSRLVLAETRGEITPTSGVMLTFIEKVLNLRGGLGKVNDLYAGRMPIAYVHFVNLLVNVYVVTSPIALFPVYGYWSVILVGFITLVYGGIFKLSLSLLDPLDNDHKHETSSMQTAGFDIAVLIREVQTANVGDKGCAMSLPKY